MGERRERQRAGSRILVYSPSCLACNYIRLYIANFTLHVRRLHQWVGCPPHVSILARHRRPCLAGGPANDRRSLAGGPVKIGLCLAGGPVKIRPWLAGGRVHKGPCLAAAPRRTARFGRRPREQRPMCGRRSPPSQRRTFGQCCTKPRWRSLGHPSHSILGPGWIYDGHKHFRASHTGDKLQ